jgi:putative tricarboxylic transport membrane protein
MDLPGDPRHGDAPPPDVAGATLQSVLAVGVIAVAVVLAWGALSIPGDAGYAGVGPNFLPWVVSAALLACGGWLLWEARTGGFRRMEPPSGAPHSDKVALAWVSAGVLATAALITTIGFVLACALCFTLAVRGLRLAEGRGGGGPRQALIDAATGLAIALPVYWLFSKLLSINLPGLTGTGWL